MAACPDEQSHRGGVGDVLAGDLGVLDDGVCRGSFESVQGDPAHRDAGVGDDEVTDAQVLRGDVFDDQAVVLS